MKKIKIVLTILLSITITIPSFANEEYGPGVPGNQIGPGYNPQITIINNNYPLNCNDDICKKILDLYSGETNYDLKKMQIEFLLSSIHPENYKSYSDFKHICNVPYTEQLFYNLPILGLSQDQIRYSIEGNILEIYNSKNENKESVDIINDINIIYDFINEIKVLTNEKTDEEKIQIIQTKINERLVYAPEGEKIYKINEVLKTGRAICTGYSSLFYLCCINTGIKCECVGSNEHMFNRVFINNEWRYIDCTWNDSTGHNNWYLISENQLDPEHMMLSCFKTS